MPQAEPRIVRWSDHASVKADLFGFARSDVEAAVLELHHGRRANTGAADWLVDTGRLVVAYNHPDGDDEFAAFVVTLWRRT